MSGADDLLVAGRRRMRFGTRVFWVLVGLAVVGVAAAWVWMPKEYRAKTIIQVESTSPRLPMTLDEPQVPIEHQDRMVGDQMVRMTSDTILSETLKSAEVMGTIWYQSGGANKEVLMEECRDMVRVRQVPGTNTIELSVRAAVAEDAAKIANAIVQRYLVDVETGSKVPMRREYEFYRDQTNTKLQQLRNRRNDMAKFRESFRSPGVTSGVNVVGDQYRLLNEEVTRLEIAKLKAKTRYESLKAATTRPVDSEGREHPMSLPQLEWLRRNIIERQLELECRLARTGITALEAESSRSELAFLQAKLDQRELDAAEREYMDATQSELQTRERLTAVEAMQADIDRRLAEMESIRQDVQMLEKEYGELNAFTNKLGMLSSGGDAVQIRQIGMAMPPRQPDYERKLIASAAIGAIPLLYGVLLILYRIVAWLTRPVG
jgi:uncharacterized protein involved in exopolysaccharide biosynthesis